MSIRRGCPSATWGPGTPNLLSRAGDPTDPTATLTNPKTSQPQVGTCWVLLAKSRDPPGGSHLLLALCLVYMQLGLARELLPDEHSTHRAIPEPHPTLFWFSETVLLSYLNWL